MRPHSSAKTVEPLGSGLGERWLPCPCLAPMARVTAHYKARSRGLRDLARVLQGARGLMITPNCRERLRSAALVTGQLQEMLETSVIRAYLKACGVEKGTCADEFSVA